MFLTQAAPLITGNVVPLICYFALGLLSTDAYKLHVYVYERIITHTLPIGLSCMPKFGRTQKRIWTVSHSRKRVFVGVTGG